MQGGLNALRFLFFLMLLIGCGIVVFFSSDYGKQRLIAYAMSQINEQELKLKVEAIDSYFPLRVRFAHIEILDKGQPLIYLRKVDLQTDLFALLEKNLTGRIHVEEFIRFDSIPTDKEETDRIQLPLSIDLMISCGSWLLEDRGSNYFITASITDGRLIYKAEQDKLNYQAQFKLDIAGQTVDLDIKGAGQINDFNLSYAARGKILSLGPLTMTDIQGQGQIHHLPWQSKGPLELALQHRGKSTSIRAELDQDHYILNLKNMVISSEGIHVTGDMSYDTLATEVNGMMEATVSESDLIQGNLRLKSAFQYRNGDLSLDLKAMGQNLSYGDTMIENLDCELSGKTMMTRPEGDLKLHIAGLNGVPSGDIRRANLKSSFKGGVGQVALVVDGDTTSGSVTADVNYQKITKTIQVQTFDAMVAGIPIKANPFRVTVAEHNVSFSPTDLTIMRSPLRLQGDIKNGLLNFAARGELNLATLSRFVLADDDVVAGRAQVDLTVTGPVTSPKVAGTAEVYNGVYENIIHGIVFRDIHLKLAADHESIRILQATGRDPQKGVVTGSGAYNLRGNTLNIELKGEQIQILKNDQMSLTARTAEMQLKGEPSNIIVSARVVADEAAYSIAPKVSSDKRRLNVTNSIVRKKPDVCDKISTASPVSFNPGLDITLEFPPVLKIHGRGLNSLWKGRLIIRGDYDNPIMGGSLDVDHGQINFLGQTVALEKGYVRFDGSPDNIPYIDTTGALEKQDMKVTVGIVGRVNKPSIDLQSQPSMPKDEIMSILFFGKDKSKLSPIEGVQLARALAAYKGIGGDLDFFGILTDNLGLDQFTVGSGATEGTYALKLSKRLGDKVRVNLNQGLKPEDSKVELEVDVTKNISVKAEHGFAGSADGASVNYNWDY